MMSIGVGGALVAQLLSGLSVSLQLTGLFLLIGLPLGLSLGMGLLQKRKVIQWPVLVVVEAGRGFPVLVILYLLYFGLPQIGMTPTAFIAAAVGLAISFGAYTSEVFRAGIAAVPPSQREAGLALGLSRFTLLRKVILPQAIRIVIPPLLGWTIVYFQASALAYAISVPELMSQAYTIATASFRYLDMLLLAAALYAAISIPASLLAERWSNRRGRSAGKAIDPTTLLK